MRTRGLGLSTVTESGVHFETGVPVEFVYVRGLEPAPNFGERYQQHIEPAGRYMIHAPQGCQLEGRARALYEEGMMLFLSPLVLRFTNDPDTLYGPTSWKMRLRKVFGGKGRRLSKKIADAGFDGIVTVWEIRGRGSHTKEIVDLTMF
jgi:hypothetical protein